MSACKIIGDQASTAILLLEYPCILNSLPPIQAIVNQNADTPKVLRIVQILSLLARWANNDSFFILYGTVAINDVTCN